TTGRVKFELFPNNVLGSDTSTREMLVEGTIDMLAIGGGYMGVFNGACDLINMLYNFSNRDELLHMYDSEWGQKYIYEPFLKNQGIRIIDYWPNNDRMTICTKPIRSVSDLSGVKIRIPSGYVTQESVWTDLGAMTVTMALGDALTGMQQGVVDAVEMPIDFIYSYGFHEVAKYLSLTSHSIYAQLIFVNEKSFQAISPDDQKVVLDTIKECGIYATDLLDKREAELKTEMVQKHGVEIIEYTDAQRKEFMDIAEKSFEKFMDKWGRDCYTMFKDVLEKYRASH
ncbi:MAG TPA: TRAP transporter substrate-binding protein, partial [Spirochaetia bacterium]|nr:TRAP transporter substrate-binding protein [Spirochaetia bacterium]